MPPPPPDHAAPEPSPWVLRWAHLVRPGAAVLDLACGRGRHARFFAGRNCRVTAVDRDAAALAALTGTSGVTTRIADLEADAWPFPPETFDAVVVTNYLHRPLFSSLAAVLRPGGVLIYETFMQGNERFGKPSNPAFLLRSDELLDAFRGALTAAGFEQGRLGRPVRAVVQRICAVRDAGGEVELTPEDGAGREIG